MSKKETTKMQNKKKPIKVVEAKTLPLSSLEPNNGQIEGLPNNPRQIKGDKFEKLKRSIEDNPEMLGMRELLVYPYGEKYVIIGGNMRYEALKALGYGEAPCKIIENATAEQLRAYTIKDNSGFGEWDWDELANDWDDAELDAWGLDMPTKQDDKENPYTQKVDTPVYEIKGDEPYIYECIDLNKVESLFSEIDSASISDEKKKMLKACAYRFAEINFANMAEYYAHQDKEVQGLMEKLALVIIDFDKAIEQGLVSMDKRMMEIYKNEL